MLHYIKILKEYMLLISTYIYDRTWSDGGCRCLDECGGSRWWMSSGECWTKWGVCTCRHSDAQVSRVLEWGRECERDSTLEAARSLIFIEVGECRTVVRHTCDRRLRNRKKCNRRWDIPLSLGRGVLRVTFPNAAFELDLLLDLSS